MLKLTLQTVAKTSAPVSPSGSARALNTACPFDLSLKTFPLGAVIRTVFGKIEVYRMSEEAFRVECWRSFADYAFGMLRESAGDGFAEVDMPIIIYCAVSQF
ncbi:hypothetical protein ACQZ44_20875 [Agrobacterium vitis]